MALLLALEKWPRQYLQAHLLTQWPAPASEADPFSTHILPQLCLRFRISILYKTPWGENGAALLDRFRFIILIEHNQGASHAWFLDS